MNRPGLSDVCGDSSSVTKLQGSERNHTKPCSITLQKVKHSHVETMGAELFRSNYRIRTPFGVTLGSHGIYYSLCHFHHGRHRDFLQWPPSHFQWMDNPK